MCLFDTNTMNFAVYVDTLNKYSYWC